MTAFASAGKVLMDRSQECCRCKHRRRIVTDAAFFLRGDMIRNLGRCDTRGMAGRAIIGIDTRMVEGYTRKGRKVVGHVAGRAIQACRYVVQRLAEGGITVMA